MPTHDISSTELADSDALARFAARPGILGYALRTHAPFRHAFAAFLSGAARVLVIAGEPGNGKSTLLDDIVLSVSEQSNPPLAVITYDAAHGMLLDALGLPLPRGETFPPVRDLVSEVLAVTVLDALETRPGDLRVLVEAPLVDNRGEATIARVIGRGHRVQAIALHNPHVWRQVVTDGQRDSELAAQVDAILAIRQRLAQHAGAHPNASLEEQERAIGALWGRWATAPDHLVLTWTGPESDAAIAATNAQRQGRTIAGADILPASLAEVARAACHAVIARIDDLPAFTAAMRGYDQARTPHDGRLKEKE